MSRGLCHFGSRILLRLKWLARPTTGAEARLLAALVMRSMDYTVPEHIWARVVDVEGFLSRKEAGLLFWAASKWRTDGPVVELGSYQGKSTILFALAGRHVHAVDAWGAGTDRGPFEHSGMSPETSRQMFFENISKAGVADTVTVHQGLTVDVAKDWSISCAILYVDAGHSYEDAGNDLACWQRHLAPDGIMIMHDVLNMRYPGVFRAAAELYATGMWRIVARAGSIAAFCRRNIQK